MAKRKPAGRKRLFENLEGKMHMPFCDGKQLIFCRSGEVVRRELRSAGSIWSTIRRDPKIAERFADLPRSRVATYRAWKLYQGSLGSTRPERVRTGLPDDAIECSPTFFTEHGVLHVSFIGGIPGTERIDYRLYELTGSSWSTLSAATPAIDLPSKLGFVSPLHICYGSGSAFALRARSGGEERKVTSPFSLLTRVSFRSENPSQLILTGYLAATVPQSFQYDVQTGELAEILGAKQAYKPTLFGDQMISAERDAAASTVRLAAMAAPQTASREDYALYQENFSLAPISKAMRTTVIPKAHHGRMAKLGPHAPS